MRLDLHLLTLYRLKLTNTVCAHVLVSSILFDHEFASVEHDPEETYVKLVFVVHFAILNELDHISFKDSSTTN